MRRRVVAPARRPHGRWWQSTAYRIFHSGASVARYILTIGGAAGLAKPHDHGSGMRPSPSPAVSFMIWHRRQDLPLSPRQSWISALTPVSPCGVKATPHGALPRLPSAMHDRLRTNSIRPWWLSLRQSCARSPDGAKRNPRLTDRKFPSGAPDHALACRRHLSDAAQRGPDGRQETQLPPAITDRRQAR